MTIDNNDFKQLQDRLRDLKSIRFHSPKASGFIKESLDVTISLFEALLIKIAAKND